jgi:GNAT superfamily N-acetyltransferase
MRIERSHDVGKVRALCERWQSECNGEAFGLIVRADDALSELDRWLDGATGTLLLAYDGTELVGFFAVFAVDSFLGNQTVALEKYWYALPNRVKAGPALFRAAKQWAGENGCSHLLVSASNLASDSHDKVSRFCEGMGMKKFETSYIEQV